MKLRAIIKRADESVGHVSYISDTLENLQKHVGGYIETVTLFPEIVIICNEDARMIDAPYNCSVLGIDFYGDILVLGEKGEEFADTPLPLAAWKEMLITDKTFYATNYEEFLEGLMG